MSANKIKKEIEEKKSKAKAQLLIAMDAAAVDLKQNEVAQAMKTLRWGLAKAQEIYPQFVQAEIF